ncbi:MAG: hypothetical protein PHE54_03000 [Bacilli bacterium]|nr:hypothetical protein [Bacilli bacterium]
MKRIFLTDEIMSQLTMFNDGSNGQEGTLYLNKKEKCLYKIYHEELLPRVKKNISGLNLYYPINNVLQANAILYRGESPFGIKIPYLDSHQSGLEIISSWNISFSEKMSICQTFVKGVKSLHQYGYIVSDINLQNVMVKDGITTLIDIYDGCFDDGSKESLEYSFNDDVSLTNMAVLSIIYNIDFEDIVCYQGMKQVAEFIKSSSLPKTMQEYIVSTIIKPRISLLGAVIIILYINYHHIDLSMVKRKYIDEYLSSEYIDESEISKDKKRLSKLL